MTREETINYLGGIRDTLKERQPTLEFVYDIFEKKKIKVNGIGLPASPTSNRPTTSANSTIQTLDRIGTFATSTPVSRGSQSEEEGELSDENDEDYYPGLRK